jgi:hypothetical protein
MTISGKNDIIPLNIFFNSGNPFQARYTGYTF